VKRAREEQEILNSITVREAGAQTYAAP
jgi:hypothetical protein